MFRWVLLAVMCAGLLTPALAQQAAPPDHVPAAHERPNANRRSQRQSHSRDALHDSEFL